MAIKVEVTGGQDFLITECDYRFTRVEGVVTPAADLDADGGLALTGSAPAFVPYTNGTGTVTGLLLDKLPGLKSGVASKSVAVLARGPAVVDKKSLFDSAGAVLDAGGLVDIAALDIKAIDAPVKIEEGNPAIP